MVEATWHHQKKDFCSGINNLTCNCWAFRGVLAVFESVLIVAHHFWPGHSILQVYSSDRTYRHSRHLKSIFDRLLICIKSCLWSNQPFNKGPFNTLKTQIVGCNNVPWHTLTYHQTNASQTQGSSCLLYTPFFPTQIKIFLLFISITPRYQLCT